MSKMTRTTRQCSIGKLQPPLRKALRDYFFEYGLGDLTAETLRCCETFTDRSGRGRLAAWLDGNPDSAEYLGLILARRHLVWGRLGDRSGTLVFGIALKDLRVMHYETALGKRQGLDVSGPLIGVKKQVRGDLELGSGEDAVQFCQAVVAETTKYQPPKKEKTLPWFNWLGGKK